MSGYKLDQFLKGGCRKSCKVIKMCCLCTGTVGWRGPPTWRGHLHCLLLAFSLGALKVLLSPVTTYLRNGTPDWAPLGHTNLEAWNSPKVGVRVSVCTWTRATHLGCDRWGQEALHHLAALDPPSAGMAQTPEKADFCHYLNCRCPIARLLLLSSVKAALSAGNLEGIGNQ